MTKHKKTLLKDCRPGCWAVALCGRTHSDGLLHVNNGKHRLQWADGDTAGGSCGKGRISLNFNGAAEMIKNLNNPNKLKKVLLAESGGKNRDSEHKATMRTCGSCKQSRWASVRFVPDYVLVGSVGPPTSRGTGLRAALPLRWAAGCWAAPPADHWPWAGPPGAPAGLR